jgi:hypothetical protein
MNRGEVLSLWKYEVDGNGSEYDFVNIAMNLWI